MYVELGNTAPKDSAGNPVDLGAPTVTRFTIHDHVAFDKDIDIAAFKAHLGDSLLMRGGITNYENAEALLTVVHPSGSWQNHSFSTPTWVFSDNEDFANVVSEYYGGIPVGRPVDLEDTHYTRFGPPGHGVPSLVKDIHDLLVNSGRDQWALRMGAGGLLFAGTATATATGSLTVAAGFTASGYIGQRIITSNGVWGNIISNTTTVATIDRWYNPTTPGSVAATTPSGTTTFIIIDGTGPAWFVGLGNTNTASSASDTYMTAEIINGTPSGENNVAGTLPSGLVRRLADTTAHSAGTNTYTLTPVFTVNSNETGILPQTIYRIGVYNSLIYNAGAPFMCFETLLSASATVSASGDQLTVTETVTGS